MAIDIYEYTVRRTGAVYNSRKQLIGSGAFISPDGDLLTCAHLGELTPDSTYVVDWQGQKYAVSSIYLQEEVDIAVLHCETTDSKLEYFSVNPKLAALKREVFVFGYPDKESRKKGYGRTTTIISRGFVSGQNYSFEAMGLLGANISEGMSGGPVVDIASGELVGIIHGYEQSLGQAIYDRQEELIGKVSTRQDDLFIPVASILPVLGEKKEIFMVHELTPHIRLLNKVIEILDLLGFKNELLNFDGDQNSDIKSHLRIGFVPFDVLIICLSNNGNQITASLVHDALLKVSFYKTQESYDKVIFVSDANLESEALVHIGSQSPRIEIVREDAILDSLIDFSGYMGKLKTNWTDDKQGIARNYIPLRGNIVKGKELIPIDSVEDFVDGWVKNSSKTKLLILGKYGSGKTTLCRYLSSKFAIDYSDQKDENRIPIQIALRDVKSLSIRQWISDLIEHEFAGGRPNLGVFSKLNDLGKILLILDGFDEMAQRVDVSSPYNSMRDLSQFIQPNSKVIITCRTEYFSDNREIDELLATDDFEVFSSEQDFEILVIEDFSHEQIIEYVTNVTHDNQKSEEIINSIVQTARLYELAQRPVLLNLIIHSLPKLLESNQEINVGVLYRYYVDTWLERDLRMGRTSIGKDLKTSIMKSIAKEMNHKNILYLYYDEIFEIVKGYFEDSGKLGFYLHDILTNSFLTRNDKDKYYQFSHKSFFEYFLAVVFSEEIKGLTEVSQESGWSFAENKITFEIYQFLRDLGITEENLWTLVWRTKHKTFEDVRYLGGNAITALRYMKADFSGKDFSDTILAEANFSDCDLSNSIMRNCNLVANFCNCNLENVDMRGSDLSKANLKSIRTIYAIDYSPTRNLLAIASTNPDVSLWKLSTDEISTKLTLPGHKDFVFSANFSPDGKILATGSRDQTIRLWYEASPQGKDILHGHFDNIRGVKFVDNQTLVSCGSDGRVIKWFLDKASSYDAVDVKDDLWGLDINQEMTLIVTGGISGTIRLWYLHNMKLFREFPAGYGEVRSVRFFGNSIVAGCKEGLLIWDFPENSWRMVHEQRGAVRSIAVDSEKVISGAEDGTIAVWTGKELNKSTLLPAHNDSVLSLVLVDSGEKLFSAGADGDIALWNTKNDIPNLISRFSEDFTNDIFNCKNLDISNTIGITTLRIESLVKNGAIYQGQE